MQHRLPFYACVLGWLFVAGCLFAQEPADWEREPIRDIRVRVEGQWIVAGQGRDETAQEVRVKIWGPVLMPSTFVKRPVIKGFEALDADPEREYVVISRGLGTGPYYKLQIIDFRKNGILTWAYYSAPAPRVENGTIFLGVSRDYDEMRINPKFQAYRYTSRGLEPVGK